MNPYLDAQLQGDASRVVAGFPLTHASYNQSVTLLKSRFGQSHKLIVAHMQALLHLQKPLAHWQVNNCFMVLLRDISEALLHSETSSFLCRHATTNNSREATC